MLKEIVAHKREEVEQRKKDMPLPALKEMISQRRQHFDFGAALRGGGVRLIAEVKRASPSRGMLCSDFRPVELARDYAEGGAAAISVLTESRYFLGSLDYLAVIREQVKLPVLRKDFIFDSYQVYESTAYGADALLLIVSILEQGRLEELMGLSRSLGLDCLVEVHNEAEVDKALSAGAVIIGINNRDLNNFTVALETSRRLRPLVPDGCTVVSESGIRSRQDVEKLMGWGIHAVLVGESLVTAGDIKSRMKELLL